MKFTLFLFFSLIIFSLCKAQDHKGHKMLEPKPQKKEQSVPQQKKPAKQKAARKNKAKENPSVKTPLERPKSKPETVGRIGRLVRYNLYIHDSIVNYTGKNGKAMVINGQIPAPTLEFTEGDTAEIWVYNYMNVETSVHWHGLLVPNVMDGVPYLTTPPILPGTYFVYKFPIIQSGTYWYHSHTEVQEQLGLYGSIVIHPKEEKHKVKDDIVVVLSDWTNQKPEKILKNLRRGNEYYTIKKGYAQSLNNLIKHNAVWERLRGSFQRMPPMDISDVYYNLFLINGEPVVNYSQFQPGDTVRLRVINAGASTMFYLNYAGGPMKIVAADGIEVEPILVDKILIANAETYDLLVSIPSTGAFEFRATAQDISGHTSLFLGEGSKVTVPDMPKLNVWSMRGMDMSGMNMGEMDMEGMGEGGLDMDDKELYSKEKAQEFHNGHGQTEKDSLYENMDHGNKDIQEGKQDTEDDMPMNHGNMPNNHMMAAPGGTIVFSYDMLKAIEPTAFAEDKPVREMTFTLTGNMYRYVWSINNTVLSESDKILIEKGEVVRVHLENTTMMNHPMHLHGHFFRVLNEQGVYAPLKHTVNVPPFSKVTFEFLANEQDDWFFHCHILYHMVTGMSRIFSYKSGDRDPLLKPFPLKRLVNEDRQWFLWGDLAVQSNMTELRASFANARNAFRTETDLNYGGQYEVEASYERFLTNYFRPYVGVALLRQQYFNVFRNEEIFSQEYDLPVAGIRYTLPFFIESDLRVNAQGRFRLELDWELWLLPRLFTEFRINTDREYHIDAQYILSRDFSLAVGYDSRYKLGAGVLWRF